MKVTVSIELKVEREAVTEVEIVKLMDLAQKSSRLLASHGLGVSNLDTQNKEDRYHRQAHNH